LTLPLAPRLVAAARGWAIAVVAAGAAAAPVAALVWLQRGQFAWLPGLPPGWHDLYLLAIGLAGGAASLILIAALGVLGARCAGGRERGRPTGPRLIWLSAPWLILPPAILFAGSRIEPSYQPRYLVFCLPAVAMLAGAGLAALERQWLLAAALVVLLAGLGLPVQHAIREPAGHGEDIRAVARLLGTQAAPGDAVIYDDPGTRTDSFAYESQFIGLRDISLRQTPAEAENLGGTQASPGIVQNRLRHVIRAWIIQVGSHRADPAAVLRGRFRLVRGWRISDIAVRLFARPAAPGEAQVTRVTTGHLRPDRRLPGISRRPAGD
jgi:mannosyltransferase